MMRPDWQQFRRLAHKPVTLVPVIKSVTADLLTPVSAFLAIARHEPRAFLLESVEGGEKIGRYTFLGVRPYLQVQSRGEEIITQWDSNCETLRGNIFRHIRSLLREHCPASVPGLPPFTAGAVGYFSYDSVRQLERIGDHAHDDLQLPDSLLMFFDRVLAFDHVRHQIHIMAAADIRQEPLRHAYDRAVADISELERKLLSGRSRPPSNVLSDTQHQLRVRASTTRQEFLDQVNRIKRYIRAGDVFQTVLSQRLEFPVEEPPFELYRALRMVNPSPYMYYLRLDCAVAGRRKSRMPLHVLGSSPEMLVRVTGRKLEYRPIAGTHPRGQNELEDQRLEDKMRNDAKERAEHVMLVDLGRNDLGRVSEYGSVQVRDLMYVERYSHVMHLASAIEGRLRSGLDAVDAFSACFPAGTLTGAPKVRAMQIIEELEPVRRGIYGGSVLYADFAGNLDSCIAIRTMVVKDSRAYVQAGAGIVADSNPPNEYQESLNKAQALLKAVDLARHGLA
jgi:anthranilate synthase component 1